MIYFVVSDLHGCYKELRDALSSKGFDPTNPEHQLVVCGDLFDRGREHVKIYHYLAGLMKQNNVIVVKGNHELFFTDLIYGEKRSRRSITFNIKHNGFGKTLSDFTGLSIDELAQYSITKLASLINERHPEFLKWIDDLPFYYETNHYVFTHAGVDLNSSDWRNGNWEEQVWQDLRTYQHINLKDYNFHKKLVMGHYPTHYFGIVDNTIYRHVDGQKIFIDGGCVYFDESTINVLVVNDEKG